MKLNKLSPIAAMTALVTFEVDGSFSFHQIDTSQVILLQLLSEIRPFIISDSVFPLLSQTENALHNQIKYLSSLRPVTF